MTVVPPLPPGLPPDLNLVRVRGRYRNLDGTAQRGPVKLQASHRLRSLAYHTAVLSLPVLELTPDSNGEISQLVPATDDPDILPRGWHYIVTEPDGFVKRVQIPSTLTEVWLDDLPDISGDEVVVPIGEAAVLASQLGRPNGVATLDGTSNVPEDQLGKVHRQVHVVEPSPETVREGDIWIRSRIDPDESAPGNYPTLAEFDALVDAVRDLQANTYNRDAIDTALQNKANKGDVPSNEVLEQYFVSKEGLKGYVEGLNYATPDELRQLGFITTDDAEPLGADDIITKADLQPIPTDQVVLKSDLQPVADEDIVSEEELATGFVMRASNGAQWRITIDSAGNFVKTAL